MTYPELMMARLEEYNVLTLPEHRGSGLAKISEVQFAAERP